MKHYKHIIPLLLCVAFLLNLCGCSDSPVENAPPSDPTSATIPSTVTPTAPAEPFIDAAALYEDALDILKDKDTYSYTVSYLETMIIGAETFITDSQQSITYRDLGKDSFAAHIEESVVYGDYASDITETYLDGKIYTEVYGALLTTDMTAEEFTDRIITPSQIDLSRYRSVSATETGNGFQILLEGATELEPWLKANAAELVQAGGQIQINANGELSKISYSADYTVLGAQFNISIQISPQNGEPAAIALPDNADAYIPVENLDVGRTMEKVYGFLDSVNALTFNTYRLTVSQAAGYAMEEIITGNLLGSGKETIGMLDTTYFEYDQSNSNTLTIKETLLDGTYTYTSDGEILETSTTIDGDYFREVALDIVIEDIWNSEYITNATCLDLGDFLLFKFSGSDVLNEIYSKDICYDLFGDETLLDQHASAYQADKMEGYIAVDKYLGLPTAIGATYQGTHTIDGGKYILSQDIHHSLYTASLTAYEAITDTPAPSTAPVEKATPLFYHVTGPDGQEMWLFGTIHVGDTRTSYLPDEIYAALDASDALALEINVETMEQRLDENPTLAAAFSNAYLYSNGKTLLDNIKDKELAAATENLMTALGLNRGNLLYAKPWAMSNEIDNRYLQLAYQLTSEQGVDNQLYRRATEQGKEVIEVETLVSRAIMYSGWSAGLQEMLLLSSVGTSVLDYAVGVNELFDLWCAGDEAELTAYLNEEADTSEATEEEIKFAEEYTKSLETDRNAVMLSKAIEYLESGETIFYAVGLAHLLAEDGLVNTLRDAGYTVELVTYE